MSSPSNLFQATYPYHSLDAQDIVRYASIVENWFKTEEKIYEYMEGKHYDWQKAIIRTNSSALLKSLRHILGNLYFDKSESKFLDCFGFEGSAIFVAEAFNCFSQLESIEFSDDGFRIANLVSRKAVNYSNVMKPNIVLRCGSPQDYFSFDSSVVYLNCAIFSDHSLLDESPVVQLVLELSKKLQPGSFVIIVTIALQLDTISCEKLGFLGVDCIYLENLTIDSNVFHLWILKTKNIDAKRRK